MSLNFERGLNYYNRQFWFVKYEYTIRTIVIMTQYEKSLCFVVMTRTVAASRQHRNSTCRIDRVQIRFQRSPDRLVLVDEWTLACNP
jgi:hypothetical protein